MSAGKTVSAILVLILVCTVGVSVALASLNEILLFEQLSYAPQEASEPVEFTTDGQCVVEYDKDLELEYLNVIALVPGLSFEPVWIVRNLPLGSEEMGPPHEQVSVQFPMEELGVENGMPIADIQYGFEVRPDPLSDDEYPFWMTTVPLDYIAGIDQKMVDVNVEGFLGSGDDEIPGFPVYPHHPPYSGFPFSEVNSWIGCDMPNVPLDDSTDSWDDSACAPASCANSLVWMRNQYGISFPGDTRNVMKQLSNLMNRLHRKGASAQDMARAKLDFIEAHNLPIHVKIHDWHSNGDVSSSSGHSVAHDAGGGPNSWPTEDWLFSESAAGEDVETCVGYWYQHNGTWYRAGGHAVVITGTGRVFDIPWIAWKHDSEQSTSGGVEQKAGTLEDTGDGLRVRGMGGWTTHGDPAVLVRYEAYIESVVSESPDGGVTPPPPTNSFGGYCEWTTRTVPPGGTLTVTFPTDTTRCMNLTVYREDRSVRPPRKVKVVVWNHNSGLVGTLTNTSTDKCITLHIHNDDYKYNADGTYVPYEVGLVVAGPSRDDTPSNPDAYGGFSLGGRDFSAAEFGSPVDPMVTIDPSIGCDLSQVPASLGVGHLTTELILVKPIPVWNVFWEELILVVDVLDVQSPGDLFVDCMSTGLVIPLFIDVPGRYLLDLGVMGMQPDFNLRLEAQNGLGVTFDAMGVASLVSVLTAVDGGETPANALKVDVYPNPFNPRTTIAFTLPEDTDVELSIFDVCGRFVTTLERGTLTGGRHEIVWRGTDGDGREVASGTYLYRLKADGQNRIGRMTLVR